MAWFCKASERVNTRKGEIKDGIGRQEGRDCLEGVGLLSWKGLQVTGSGFVKVDFSSE